MREILHIDIALAWQLLDVNFETGIAVWKPRSRDAFKSQRDYTRFQNRYAGKVAGCVEPRSGRTILRMPSGNMFAHRVFWTMYHGRNPGPGMHIDHIDGNASNNSIHNLREATLAENNRNVRMRKATGYKGVEAYPGGWRYRVVYNRKCYQKAGFATAEEARDARNLAARQLHGEFFNPG